MVGETVQVEQSKNTIASGHSLFLYIDNIIYNKIKTNWCTWEEKKSISLDWPNAMNKYERFFSSIRMSPKTWLNQNTIPKHIGSFYTLFWLVKNW